MLGRLMPSTGEIKLDHAADAARAALRHQAGLAGRGLGRPTTAPASSASMDPVTMEVREYPLPDPASRSRRLAITSDDMVWFVNSSLGRLGRLNPKTGEVKEWPSPSGANRIRMRSK